MKGGIFSDEKCPLCGSTFKDTGSALTCPAHPHVKASKFRVKFKKTYARFNSYKEADIFLNGLRWKTTERTYDPRDYRKDNPLSFSKMSDKYLTNIKSTTAKNIRFHIHHAQKYFADRNVKSINYGDIEDFLNQLSLKDKTKHNIVSTLREFYRWMKRRGEINDIPDFPEVSYVLGYRQTIDKATQHAIIEEVKRICPNIKVYLGIKWLATYFSIRPAEMINLQETNIDLANGYFYIPHPKEKKYKTVPILPDDISLIKSCGISRFPGMRFFRHIDGIQGCAADKPFGLKYFYKWWIKACTNLKIYGVDLYGGTRHSSVRALRPHRSPEEIKAAAMSKTNKAFDRYLGQPNDLEILSLYKQSAQVIPMPAPGTILAPLLKGRKKAN